MNIFTETYTHQPNTNRLAAVSGQTNESYSYNAVGSISGIDSKFLKYNQDNRLTRIIDASGANAITVDFTYNAYGQRVSKSSNLYAGANIYLYDFDGNLIAEADGAGNITTEYLYMDSNRLAKVDTASGNIYFYINDRLGTPIMMVDSTNTVVWEATYKPFGEAEVNPTSTVENNFRFPGQYYDIETGMHYNWHRYYDPSTGSYLTPDPVGLAGGINLYLYAGANPINSIDPYGLDSYLVSRGLNVAIVEKVSSHNFIVSNANYIGDPNATIYSYAENASGNVGRVFGSVNEADYNAWIRMKSESGCPNSNPNVSRIAAPDSRVAHYANFLIENQDYAAFAGPFGSNSNSAAQAIANRASRSIVPTPSAIKASVGAGNWKNIQFSVTGASGSW